MTAITAEGSRALLARRWATTSSVLTTHLRAALDREVETLVQIGELAEQVGWLGNDLRRAEAERDAARAEAERLRAVLRFYASENGWDEYDPAGCDQSVMLDGGDRARAALAQNEALDAQAGGRAMGELLPCPFCGNDGSGPIEDALHITSHQWGSPSWAVQCDKCTATMGYSDSEEAAIEAWNTRADLAKEASE